MSDTLFYNKTVIVTGAGGGIGRSHALAFARAGAQVVVNDVGGGRDGTAAQDGRAAAVVSEIRAAGGVAIADTHSVAVRDGAEGLIETALEAFGQVDVLVNNAGILRDRSLLKMSDAEWQPVLEVHLQGTFLCTQLAARQMAAQGRGGAIINTTSTSGLLGNFGQGNYGAAKAGIAGLTRVAAIEMHKHGVRVNAIAPMAKTRMTEELEQVAASFTPAHISPLVLFLASPHAAAVTGRIFAVWGGQIQEWYYTTSEGATHPEQWTVAEIASRWEDITRQPAPPATLDFWEQR